MRDWSPRSLWHALRDTVERWMAESDGDDADPALLFHLAFTAPLLIGLIVLLRNA
jgi:hypothetical protein